MAPGLRPVVNLVQRHYPSQRSEPIYDAVLRFDPRTAFEPAHGVKVDVKPQPQWLRLAYEVLESRKSNLQLQIGAEFMYASCEAVRTEKIADAVAAVWRACQPFLAEMEASGGTR